MGVHGINAEAGFDYSGAAGITDGNELNLAFTGLKGGNFEQKHARSSTTTFITKGATAPAGPAVDDYWDNGTGLFKYTTGGWIPVSFVRQATAPTGVANGVGWYDTTLKIARVYDTVDGITGWHPVDGGYQLWTNKSGADMAANRVAVLDTSSVTPREFTSSTTEKDTSVVGVLLEAIADDASGVIVTVESGKVVDIYALGSTHGSIAAGDGIVHSTTSGASRGVGTLEASASITTTTFVVGRPIGSFAQALAALSSDGLLKCRLLGSVGAGALRFVDAAQIDSYTTASAWNEIDVTSSLADSAHGPILAAVCDFRVGCQSAASGTPHDITNEYIAGPEQDLAKEAWEYRMLVSITGNSKNFYVQDSDVRIPTSDDTSSPTGMGNKFAVYISELTPSATDVVSIATWLRGYIY